MSNIEITAWVVCSSNKKKFLQVGTGNSEYDVGIFVDSLIEATIFKTKKEAESTFSYEVKGGKRERHPANYWHSKPSTKDGRETGKFMQTAMAKEIAILMIGKEKVDTDGDDRVYLKQLPGKSIYFED
jgi:hypothetical protein